MKVRNASAFLRSGLQQRLLSSTEAFWRTLGKHDRTIQEARKAQAVAPTRSTRPTWTSYPWRPSAAAWTPTRNSRPTRTPSAPDQEDPATVEADRQTEKATLATLGDTDHPNFAREMALLADMLSLADRARHQPDEKLKKLFEYIDRNMVETRPDARWNEHRIIVFTEYDDTLAYVRRHLEAHIRATDRRRRTAGDLPGGTSLEERQEIKEAFNADPAVNPVRILLATDAAREGLNLQKYCSNLFHFDIPWNPARLEQRNGRIDRKLQPSPTVYCRYFLYENREEDTILRRIVEKTETIYRELGGFSTVLDKGLIQSLRRRGIERIQGRRDHPDVRLRRPRGRAPAPALALAEVSGDEDDDETSRPSPRRRTTAIGSTRPGARSSARASSGSARSSRRASAGSTSATPSSAPRSIARSG